MPTRKADTGKVKGNQTPNTPNVDESTLRDRGWEGVDTGKLSGNHTRNTRSRNESERTR